MKQTLTFYRKMANSNTEIIKKYKSSVINKMTYDELVNIYITNNLEFDQDIERIKKFISNSVKCQSQMTPESTVKCQSQMTPEFKKCDILNIDIPQRGTPEESVFEPLNIDEHLSNNENNSEPRDITSETEEISPVMCKYQMTPEVFDSNNDLSEKNTLDFYNFKNVFPNDFDFLSKSYFLPVIIPVILTCFLIKIRKI